MYVYQMYELLYSYTYVWPGLADLKLVTCGCALLLMVWLTWLTLSFIPQSD